MGRKTWVAPVLILVSAAAVLGGTALLAHQGAAPVPTDPPPATSPSPAELAVRYGFDTGLAGLIERTVNGAAVAEVPHGSGRAVAFPGPCADYAAARCPRVILEGDRVLNPGTRNFRWGASILMTAADTTEGSNVVQKGWSTGGGQYKLQVDGHAGRPSCVLVGSGARQPIHVALAAVSVADGRWHTVDCARTAGLLTIAVDGVPAGSVAVPTDLAVVNDQPLRIGGKGTSPNDDQFSGSLDDVYVAIDR